MKTSLYALCAVLPFCTALPISAPAQVPALATASPVSLHYKYVPGQINHYQMTMDMNMAMDMGASGLKLPAVAQHVVMDFETTVQSVNPADGSATLRERITQMNATMNGQPIPGLAAATDAYKGGFTLVMSPAGKMLSMQLPPALADKVPSGMDFSKLGSMAPSTLPQFPARVGDTWQDTASLPMFGSVPGMPSLTYTVFSTLAGVGTGAQPIADIHRTYEGTLGGAVPTGAAGKMGLDGQFHGDSTTKFDVASGSIASQDGTMTMNDTVAIPKTAATAQPMSMKMRLQMTTHMERLP